MGQADMDIAPDAFVWRHVGPRPADIEDMLKTVGADSLRALVDQAVPDDIRQIKDFNVPLAQSEAELLDELGGLADQNHVFRSFIGMGYSDCAVPSVIQRNILENPGWYTQYTPYQSEISQGRLEALLNFQTMVSDLCGLDIANASMLDEATAAAEAMTMLQRVNPKNKSSRFFVGDLCHPQTIEVVQTRAAPLGIEVVVCAPEAFDFSDAFGCLVSYPSTDGRIADFSALAQKAHDHGALVVAATDLLALTLLKPPGEWGADVCVGNAQRFGVPLGYGGPHAAFFATRDAYKRQIPGRMVGVSVDKEGRAAFRLALQTREQHIRREKATSNICTAQVLLAIMSSMYAVYHGPDGLTRIAQRVHEKAITLRATLAAAGLRVGQDPLFDTVRVEVGDLDLDAIRARLVDAKLNVRLPHLFARSGTPQLSIALDELTTDDELRALAKALTGADQTLVTTAGGALSSTSFARSSGFLTHPIFSKFKSETEFLRYTHRLQAKDLSLTTSMIPLGSCTMKLNATSEMVPITWPGFSRVHPYAPDAQGRGYKALVESMGQLLTEITGHAGVSFQPNAGSQGEYTGLLVIRAYHASRGEAHRDVCLIPSSAHGTNPASATMAGMRVVVVKSDAQGNIDHDDLADKLARHKDNLAAVMITYPSTHGVFEAGVRAICEQVHAAGGQVYLDGANMNAQVGLCRPGNYGADVLHLNLHKTFCIPHGGGGPGLGPITVAPHLKDFLPRSPLVEPKNDHQVGPVAAARYSSASILPIPWMYIRLLGSRGLRLATELAILNANYMKDRLKDHYEILFVGAHGRVAHEFIVNAKPFEACGIKVEDIAKRLMDYGFHAPTMSWPVPGTLMIEPTESESKEELDRFCDAMIHIRAEIRRVEDGTWPQDDNPLVNAPHTASSVTADAWDHAYTRQEAAYPADWIVHSKFWPSVRRVDNVYGDRHVVCACPPLEDYQ